MALAKPDDAWRDARAKAQRASTAIGWQLVVPAGWVAMFERAELSSLGKQTAAKLVSTLVGAVERMQGKVETDAHVRWRTDVADAAKLIASVDGGSASETDRDALEQRRQALLSGGIDAATVQAKIAAVTAGGLSGSELAAVVTAVASATAAGSGLTGLPLIAAVSNATVAAAASLGLTGQALVDAIAEASKPTLPPGAAALLAALAVPAEPSQDVALRNAIDAVRLFFATASH